MKIKISRTVWLLSIISLFTDIASEMLYPVMPLYLRQINFSFALIGLLEGFAEAIAGLSKGYFGELSDKTGKRVSFVRAGYSLSAISKPLIALFVNPIWVFIMRTSERLGKGIRTAARDALLSEQATPETKGAIFGFHRAFDTLGAAIGPVLALIFLTFVPSNYRLLFFLSLFPGICAIILTFLLKENSSIVPNTEKKVSFVSFISYLKNSPIAYKYVVFGLLAFALINSSDVFLLLKIKEATNSDKIVIGVYIFYNIVYALLSYPLGKMADKIGLKQMLVGGFFIFSLVYLGMGFAKTMPLFLFLFFFYGVYAAATEGISKALISNIVDKTQIATAIGTYTAFQSVMTLLASSLTGLIWNFWGAKVAFLVSSLGAFVVAIYFIFFVKIKKAV